MDVSGVMTAAILVIAALVDRFVVRRQGLLFESIGAVKHDVKRGVYIFECTFMNKSVIRLRGAEVRYCIYDDNDPTNVIEGKDLTLNFLKKGKQSVNLFISDKYVVPGSWEVSAELIYGNCIWNPLYRLFPYRTTITKQQLLTKD